MAKKISCRLKSSRIKILRQIGTDNFWASWSFTSAQKKRKITRKVYNAAKKKKKSTTKKFSDLIDSYTVKWYYRVSPKGTWYLDKTITGLKFTNTSSDLWTPPENAVQIKVTVRPIAKKYRTSSSGTASWFNINSTSKIDSDYDPYPSSPSIQIFSIVNKTLTATVNIDTTNLERYESTKVRLQVFKDAKSIVKFNNDIYLEKSYGKNTPVPSSGLVTFTKTLSSVGSYQVRAAIGCYDGGYKWSEYSEWSTSIDTRPQTPTLLSVKAIDEDKVKLVWKDIPSITQYEIEYVSDNIEYFDSGVIQTVSVDNLTSYIVTGLESGHVWYFRIRSINSSDKSSHSKTLSTVLAVKPSIPTTWSSTTVTSITSDIDTTDEVSLYWVHNSADGSAQHYTKFEFKIADTIYYLIYENTKTDEYGDLIDEISTVDLWSLVVYADAETNNHAVGTIYELFKTSGSTSILWKVCTKGIHNSYSDWSVERVIDVYEQPNLELSVCDAKGNLLTNNILYNFPMIITGSVTPTSQTPISFYISVTTSDTYDTVDIYGNDVTIIEGTEIYSKYLDVNALDFSLSASDVDFVTDVGYTLTVIVYTDGGLAAEASYNFTPSWEEDSYEPEALIEYNEDYRYADIKPYCTHFIGIESEADNDIEYEPIVYIGTLIEGEFDDDTIFPSSGVEKAVVGDMYFNKSTNQIFVCTFGGDSSTATWLYRTTFDYSDASTWYSGVMIDGDNDSDIYRESGITFATVNDFYLNTNTGDIFRCTKEGDATVALWVYVWNCFWEVTPNVLLSIYRREQDGSYTTIAENVDNSIQSSDSALSFRDLHPNFNSCVYRIVATNIESGGVGYVDMVENFRETSVIIQWDEIWRDSIENGEGKIFEGSILELPANIELSDRNSKDVSLVEYIGRKRPVTYYGTQKGENLNISCAFDKSDATKLTLIRQLMAYQGDVYIREPSGLGYWANVSVSYDRKYKALTIPVTLTIKPVEGGI